jgi:CheY-specific phosphatase CheX
MQNTISEIALRANTALFAQKICSSLDDMLEENYAIQAKSLQKGYYQSEGTFCVLMHFAGTIQGDFILTTEETVALQIVNAHKGLIIDDHDVRKNISTVFSEMVNVAAGQTIPELEKKYGLLTLIPAYTVFGELRTANVISGNVDIAGQKGTMRCTLSINLASLRIIES